MSPALARLGVVALPLLCFLASEEAGASMFIAAFVAGLAVQVGFQEAGRHSVEFTEEWGQLVQPRRCSSSSACWSRRRWPQFTAAACGCTRLLSLTVVRMLPVALALCGHTA